MRQDDYLFYKIIWAAGFWEGEGSCGVYFQTDKRYRRIMSSVTQADKAPILVFKELFGGCVSEEDKNPGVFKIQHKWAVQGQRAYIFLKTILPHVQSKYKKNQINKALREWDIYMTSLGKMTHITKRERQGKIFYEVRIGNNGDCHFVGSFKDPELAYLAKLEAISKLKNETS